MNRAIRIVGGFFLDIIETVVIALSIFLIVYLFVMQPHQVNGKSMYPTFDHGEYLLTDKVSYKTGEPHRGDVVVFRAPDAAQCPEGTGCDFIKRVIGEPGDSVEISNGTVRVNGVVLDEVYIADDIFTQEGAFTSTGAIQVPAGQYFVMGDNRPHSSDSRVWGPVPMDKIVGKVFFRYWPPGRIGVVQRATY